MVKGRAPAIWHGVTQRAAEKGVVAVEDAGLLDEVAGLVEWPVPLLGRIDDAFMDLPPEVMQVSMRVNQRYFATRTQDGAPAPWFAFAANQEAPDGGAAIVAGNERVLRARFADARHFWDLDRRTKLADRVGALDSVTFQAELGSQGDRVRRLVRLAGAIAPMVGADVALAERAALLAKADLTTGMVGEFPELQGVMGGYYAAHDGEDARVAAAVRGHYTPKGAGDTVPSEPACIAVALADKLDQLAGFFSIGQAPSGSGDPYALRRAALGVIRTVRENGLRMDLDAALRAAVAGFPLAPPALFDSVQSFIFDRLRVQYKGEGGRPDILAAAIGWRARDGRPWHTDIVRLFKLATALEATLLTDEGRDLLAAYKRAGNILRIEGKAGWPHGDVDPSAFDTASERALHAAHRLTGPARSAFAAESFDEAVGILATLREPLDAFFTDTTVNDPNPTLRANRLNLLGLIKRTFDDLADFSTIET
jgi:glycyl-tRNA synthetase beta chain